ncbi:GLPGLI family protein [Flavobacterium sandaracinum]|uniref:GLPGLI family protein n=1 Tax=Flavobacterium sandaracinum TaxID=2541733 RepID=A0A4R5D024_9FLAO|nr:GLPGLI family protein [Flavobacterium sandaracinum]TDE05170.1 GLPGLI family protein [Flavobacterium sandaracinum]
MKKIFLLLVAFVCLTSYGQVTKGKIIYSISVNADENVLKSDKMGSTYSEMSKTAGTFSYVLRFSGSKTSFQKENKLIDKENDEDRMISDLASVMFTTQYNYYFDFKDNYVLSEIEGTLIKDTIKPINWVVKSNSKVIDGITCFQALSEIEYISRDNKTKFKKIVAWFAPSLPYSFGPKNFHGLPGLILELTENRTTYLATRLDFKDAAINIDFPKGKTISQDDYIKKILSN